MKWRLFMWSLAAATFVGCGGDDGAPGPAKPAQPAASAPAQPPAPPSPPEPPAAAAPVAGAPAVPAPPDDRKAAVVGVGKRGRGYGAGVIATPIAAYFSTKERVAFDIQLTSAMNLYQATNGHFPKTHEEFMEEIVKKNSIKLPELPAGERYVYDAAKAATLSQYDPKDPPLMVEKTQ